MTPLWTLREIESLIDCNVVDKAPTVMDGISIDSRSVQSGDLFIALSGDPGPRFGGGNVAGARDGHEFIKAAVKAGASAVMASKPVAEDVSVIEVADTIDGLWELGAAARDRSDARRVAITGSSGKTTLRHWLEPVCAAFGPAHASIGSLNNHWGVPLSMARMPRDTEIGVFEVGTNHPGEIAPLSELVKPDVSVLLNVLPAHIGNFPSMNALTEEKLSIASGLNSGGVFVLPHSLKDRAAVGQRLSFGFEAGADVTGKVEQGELMVRVGHQEYLCHPPYLDTGRSQSVLAVFAVCHALGLNLDRVAEVVADLDLPVGRGNLHRIGDVTVIDDSYNANPVSMRMAIEDLSQRGAGRRIALLGEILELGDMGPSAHREMIQAAINLDRVVTFGDGFASAGSEEHGGSASDFDLTAFVSSVEPGDTLLIKGSNRVFWQHGFVNKLVDALKAR